MKTNLLTMKTNAGIAMLRAMSVFAMAIALMGVSSTCFIVAYQDEIPENAKKLRRF